jgi:hypothetical protein
VIADPDRRDQIARWIIRDTQAPPPASAPPCATFCDDLYLSEHRPIPGQPSSADLHKSLRRQLWKARVKAKVLTGIKGLGRITSMANAGVVGWEIGTALRPLFYSTTIGRGVQLTETFTDVKEWIPYEKGEVIFGTTTAPEDGYVALFEPGGQTFGYDSAALDCPSRLTKRPKISLGDGPGRAGVQTIEREIYSESVYCLDYNPPRDLANNRMNLAVFSEFDPQQIRERATGDKGTHAQSPDTPARVADLTIADWPATRDGIIEDLRTSPERGIVRDVVTWVHRGSPAEDDPLVERVAVPQPEPGEKVQTYVQTLTELGLEPNVVTLTETQMDPAAGPDTVITVVPQPGTRVEPGSVVTVRANPPDAPPATALPTCAGVTVPAINLAPLSVPLASVFPFGVFGWLADTLGGWGGGGALPTLDIPIPGIAAPLHLDVAWAIDPIMAVLRPLMLIVSLLGLCWLFASSALGFHAGSRDD